MQKTNFPCRALVADDCSADGTQEIIREYAREYPSIIKSFLSDRNIGITGPEESYAWSVIRQYSTAKYLAFLEGDDYWTDPHKLQKQADYLDAHPECSMCFHNVRVVTEGAGMEGELWHAGSMKAAYSFDELLAGNFIQTPSVMFRNGLVTELPSWFSQMPMGDWPLWLLLARHGSIGYLEDVMAVYRRHDGGVWSSRKDLENLERFTVAKGMLLRHLAKGHPREREFFAGWHDESLVWMVRKGEYRQASYHAKRLLARRIAGRERGWGYLLGIICRGELPWLWRFASWLRTRARNER